MVLPQKPIVCPTENVCLDRQTSVHLRKPIVETPLIASKFQHVSRFGNCAIVTQLSQLILARIVHGRILWARRGYSSALRVWLGDPTSWVVLHGGMYNMAYGCAGRVGKSQFLRGPQYPPVPGKVFGRDEHIRVMDKRTVDLQTVTNHSDPSLRAVLLRPATVRRCARPSKSVRLHRRLHGLVRLSLESPSIPHLLFPTRFR